MNIKQKLASAAVFGAMVAAVVAPSAFASTTVTITGNGAFSHNKVKSFTWNSNSVSQTTTTIASTLISAKAKTGNNSSSFNTGGSSNVTSGNATNTIGVSVTGGSNTNTGGECGCQQQGSNDVTISGNGAFSSNHVVIVNGSSNSVEQSSTTVAETGVWASASTGGNSSSFNTGGSNTVTSGNATNEVAVQVSGGSNTN